MGTWKYYTEEEKLNNFITLNVIHTLQAITIRRDRKKGFNQAHSKDIELENILSLIILPISIGK